MISGSSNFTLASCIPVVKIDYWDIPPYIFKVNGEPKPKGIFVTIVEDLIKSCCEIKQRPVNNQVPPSKLESEVFG